MSEAYLLRQAFAGSIGDAANWIAGIHLVAMFTVLVFRPQRIGDSAQFRLSYILFGLFLILPGCLTELVRQFVLGGDSSLGSARTVEATIRIGRLAGQVLLAGSVVIGLNALNRAPASAGETPEA